MPSDIPTYSEIVDDDSNFNLLLMGKHGSNVDTIMFANVNEDTRKITFISIPRDLYLEGRKINSVYAAYGLKEQVRWIEELMGYKIEHYALVDMYAFRDIIDLMGGLDLTLEESLVDPTYRTCDNGVCSTLYYEAGVHHLNGTQALRVARSRHTTSDYSRAERQQLILEALQDKAKKLGLGDSVSLLKILKTILGSMDTDMSVQEAVGAYFKYQGFQIERGNVLSTANVLDNVPVPVNYVTSHVIQDCSTDPCHDQYAIDTLQPRGGNMNTVRWWVDGVLNSD